LLSAYETEQAYELARQWEALIQKHKQEDDEDEDGSGEGEGGSGSRYDEIVQGIIEAMKEDEGKVRFFGSLSLFMFSMTGIVLAGNLFMMFIFWELVGLSSYLLIGHWFEKPSAAEACKKAFLTNRIGDFGFMIGILMLFMANHGDVSFSGLKGGFAEGPLHEMTQTHTLFMTLAALGIFMGAVGKSAQFPLHVWLPDAMEGPTPVSALIHAATMVAAGVFMLVRCSFVIEASPDAATIIAWIGGLTALMAALMAT
jgi:NADH-quinone oxidoreductase subunit L